MATNYIYDLVNNEAIITQYIGSDTDVTIPEKLDSYPVIGIDNSAFRYNTILTKLTINHNLTIGNFAFANCNKLQSVTLNNITAFGEHCFFQCENLDTFISPQLTNIPYGNFINSGPLTITDFSNVLTVSDFAFNVSYITNVSLPLATSIGKSAFAMSDIVNIYMPNVSTIGSSAFNGTSITSIDLPKIQSIDDWAFTICFSLTDIILSCNLSTLGDDVFGTSGINSIIIDYGTADISNITITDWNLFVSKLTGLDLSIVTGKYAKNNVWIKNLSDITPPVITILGNNPMTITLGSTYVDPGAIAIDDFGGPVTLTTINYVLSNVAGKYDVIYTAKDSNGNSSTATRVVYVNYGYSGLLQPINQDGSSVFKAGSTVPTKFQLRDSNGQFIKTAKATLSYALLDHNVPGPINEAISTSAATTGNNFRYDSSSNQYVFNLSTKTLTTGSYNLIVTIDDGQTYYNKISLK